MRYIKEVKSEKLEAYTSRYLSQCQEVDNSRIDGNLLTRYCSQECSYWNLN